MIATLQLIAVLVLGFLGTHFVAERVRRRFHVVSGIEFILLGALAGPYVGGIMTSQVLAQVEPVVSVALGAIGLLIGLRFKFASLLRFHGESLALAFYAVVSTVLLVGGAAAGFVVWRFHPSQWEIALAGATALGAIAAVSGADAISSVRAELSGGGRLGQVLEMSARLGHVLAMVFFGLVFCAFHVGTSSSIRQLTPVEWMVANIGFGLVLGILFVLFLGRETNKERLQLALMGIVLFASGTAFYLNLSPLFINVILGAMLSNTSRRADALRAVMQDVERPLLMVVLVIAGASWNLPGMAQWVALVFIAIVLLGRPLALGIAGWMTFRYGERTGELTPWMGSGLVAQGGLAIAMAVDFQQVYQHATADALLSAVIVSVVVWEFFAPPRIRVALLDSEPTLAAGTPGTGNVS